jgi:glycerophosphoryl diester phosphodiesterase
MTIRSLVILSFMLSTVAKGQHIPKFDVQGHRGARGLKPENTVPAFLTALNYGVTTIELDLAVTKNNQLVVSHEPWISPAICLTATGDALQGQEKQYNIYQMTYDEIGKFDCGSKFNERFTEQTKLTVPKPLLSDVIVAVEDHIKSFTQYEVDYNIEIKTTPEGDNVFHPGPEAFSDLVHDLIDQYLPLERVVIQSFDFRVLKYWHTKYPEIRLAALVENTKSIDWNLKELGFIPSIYSPEFTLLSKGKIDYLHEKKIRVIPWTVNSKESMKQLKGWGVDGFITDYPNRSAELGFNLKMNTLRK